MYILVVSLQCNIKLGNLNDESLEDIYNSDLMKDIRVKMLNDERHEACSRCYHQEDSGGHSMRHRANKSWKKHENLIETTEDDGTVEEMKLPYWDFRFSNICNFKCRSCFTVKYWLVSRYKEDCCLRNR